MSIHHGSRRSVRGQGWLTLAAFVWLSAVQPLSGQSSPGDLLDLTLAELGALELEQDLDAVSGSAPRRGQWQVRHSYVRGEFEGYRSDTRRVANSEIIGPPDGRTFPILQNNIVQEAHLIAISFGLSDRLSVQFVAPYLRQRTDHESIVEGYSSFSISSLRVGDLAATVSGVVVADAHQSLTISTGISVPTRSIMKTGNTPSGPGSQLPYTMQLGSGTFDVPLAIRYRRTVGESARLGRVEYGLSGLAKFRMGTNSRGYCLGDRLVVGTSMRAHPWQRIAPSIGVSGEVWGDIEGHDSNFPGPIYPTPVASPLLGGLRASAEAGLRFTIRRSVSADVDVSIPVYQSLSGPQPEEDWRLSFGWTWSGR